MRGSERCAGTTTSEWCLDLARLSGPCLLRSKTLSPSRSKRTSYTRYHARVERSTSERPRDTLELGSRSTRTLASNARPISQRSPSMLGQRTTPSTGVVLRFCSALATPWSCTVSILAERGLMHSRVSIASITLLVSVEKVCYLYWVAHY